jgi:23S rRNA (uracil1939-C5)-methyltransferase
MEHTLVIKKIITGGKGLGTLPDGMVIMVPSALPGETVVVRETKAHKGYKEAQLVQIIDAAPERIAPPCPYYQDCGGCDLQHASYSAQLHCKQQILLEALERAHLEIPEGQPAATLPSPTPFGYRYRVRLHLDKAGQLGFHQKASNQVVPIRRCLLATEPINRVIGALVAGAWPQRLKDSFASLELINCPASDAIILVLQPRLAAPPTTHEAGLSRELGTLADQVVIQEDKPGHGIGSETISSELSQHFALLGHTYRLSWDHPCFFQVNAQQNIRLVELALDLLAVHPTPFPALDLFCGMGNFSIPLGLMGAQVTGIEHNQRSILWAERNSRDAGLLQARFIAGDVEQHLKKLVARNTHFDCILLDPPRQGLGKGSALLPQLGPQQIIYISCDPATLARDLRLITAGGYRLTQITPVDMFPQTHHIESVALLERN